MIQVAIISQPLRASHCAAYFANEPASSVVIISPAASAFANLNLQEGVEIRSPLPHEQFHDPRKSRPSDLRQHLKTWSRGGSTIGMRFESLVRSASWRLRYFHRFVAVGRQIRSRAKHLEDLHDRVFEQLEDLHESSTITLIVTFDVFDLPIALRFGEAHNIPVLVR